MLLSGVSFQHHPDITMLTIQALRRSRGITLIDLALLSGIPARTIAAIECGLQRLDQRTREQLAHVFAVPPESLQPGTPPALQLALRERLLAEARLVAPVVGAALATAVALAPALAAFQPERAPALPAQVSLRVADPTLPALPAADAPRGMGLAARLPVQQGLAGSWPTAAPALAPPALDGATLSAHGPKAGLAPYGCPLAADAPVVITQGYGIGTHAPAESWGALDLGVDRDGDGMAEPESSRGALVFTPHAGVAHVVFGSWPGGNYVRIGDEAGWATAYAHLEQVFVGDGQALEAGVAIGTVGSTGSATGPHLHYEVWRDGVNLDPSPFVRCVSPEP
jgi:murein DD-endopeptidase MepM/ murein hydrolase activator NlpD